MTNALPFMNPFELEQVLIEELGYSESPEFRLYSNDLINSIEGVHNVYSVRGIPVAYFGVLTEFNEKRLWELHRGIWNESKVPLLYVIMPNEIRVYNCYELPSDNPEDLDRSGRLLRHLTSIIDVETARTAIHNELFEEGYDRLRLETGAFWSMSDGKRITRKNRADQKLLDSMDQVRRHLLKEGGITNDLAYTLLGRSILICYLQDRGVITPSLIQEVTATQSLYDFRSMLSNKELTYNFFEHLNNRFNGDIFPLIAGERDLVEIRHLNVLERFFAGENLDSNQKHLPFWPYDFRYIPIELISGIYDTFLYGEDEQLSRRRLGAYYTPLPLVDFIVDQTLDNVTFDKDVTVLDPACGSGVFLVRAYQRLVENTRKLRGSPITSQLAFEILSSSIFGIDIKQEAVRIASFSLCITLMDYLDNEDILNIDFKFPKLQGVNLIVSDFFSGDVDKHWQSKKFDYIIGNPPWGEGTLTDDASTWLKSNGHEVADNQIVQAFLLRVPSFAKSPKSQISMLAPTRSTILGTSNPNESFRKKFFEKYNVHAVVNFSALVYELFPRSLSPATVLFYHPDAPKEERTIVYGVPKPSPMSQHIGAIVLDATEVKHLNLEDLLSNPLLWKIASWGSPRDAALIAKLQKLPKLGNFEDLLGWEIKEGFQVGSDGNPTPEWLKKMTFLPTEFFDSYFFDTSSLQPTSEEAIQWPRSVKRFLAPFVLIHQSNCEAAFVNQDLSFLASLSSVTGRPGQEKLLKWLASYINSPLAKYYHFLTSSRWAVERGNIIQKEYERMPFFVPSDNDTNFKEVVRLYDRICKLKMKDSQSLLRMHQRKIEDLEIKIEELVFDMFKLSSIERELVKDMVQYGIGFFQWSKKKTRQPRGTPAVQAPTLEMLKDYASAFTQTASALLKYQDQTLNATVFHNGAPLSVIGFELVETSLYRDVEVASTSNLKQLLQRLDKLLLEQKTSTLYVRRHVRIYDNTTLFLVRPGEQRFWTKSQARVDADSFLAEVMQVSRAVTT